MDMRRTLLALGVVTLTVQAQNLTVGDRLAEFGPVVDQRLAPRFASAAVPYPPAKVTLIGFKAERELHVYAAGTNGTYRWIHSYPVLAASGHAGPKLRQGDAQVPEGFYRVESLNPNSLYHLSLRIDYPSEWDRAQARAEGRTDLGGDIMIHGNAVSAGCLAVGDRAAEDLFVLAARTGLPNLQVILSPVDLRRRTVAPRADDPPWLPRLYDALRAELRTYERP